MFKLTKPYSDSGYTKFCPKIYSHFFKSSFWLQNNSINIVSSFFNIFSRVFNIFNRIQNESGDAGAAPHTKLINPENVEKLE